jgi:Flp pilus assembly protein TadG
MRAFLNRASTDRRGASAIEFALVAPLLLALVLGVVEIGRLVSQADAVAKSLRAAAVFAARSELPLDSAATTTIENLIKTGTPDGTGAFIVDGWEESGADVTITPRTETVEGEDITVIRLNASVPFVPLMPGLLSLFGLGDLKISTSHDQTYIGL